jgi:hypothetical protein
MKYVKIVVSMIVFSGGVYSMEVVGDENRLPFAFSNGSFFMGSSGIECSKPAVRRKQQKITNYYPKVAKRSVPEEGSFDARVKRLRVTGGPLSEIDTNAQAVTALDSEVMLMVSGSGAGRARSEALSEDDLKLIEMLSCFGIDNK